MGSCPPFLAIILSRCLFELNIILVPFVYSPFEVRLLRQAVVFIHDLVSALEKGGQLGKHVVLLAESFEGAIVRLSNSGDLGLDVSAGSRGGARVYCAED